MDQDPIEVFDSSVKLIKEMRQKGIKIAVASSSKNTVNILEKTGLKDLFDAIVTGNDFKKGKPDPEIFLLAGKKIGLPTQACVVFEDAEKGMFAAIEAGIPVIVIRNQQTKGFDFDRADLTVESHSEMVDLLRRAVAV